MPDVNVLLYAHRRDSITTHAQYADWLSKLATGPEPFALSVLVLSGFVRIATNRRIFNPPSTTDQAFRFIAQLIERPNARVVGPGPDHLALFERLCRVAGASGDLVADAQQSRSSMDARWYRPTPTLIGSRDFDGNTPCAHVEEVPCSLPNLHRYLLAST